jgi:putative zinc finger protein
MSTHPDPAQLSAYIDGELTGAERDDLEQHLTGCSDCSATLRALRATVADMRALPAPLPSEQESWALRAAITKARKRPATRYQRWAIAAGSVAAVAIAIVTVANVGQRPNPTFSHTGTEVAPQAAAGTGSAASLIEIDPTNYTHASAPQLLSSPPTAPLPAPYGSAGSGSTANGGTTGGTQSSQKTLDTVTDAQRAAYLSSIQRCEQQVLPNNVSTLTPLRYIVGTYEGTPVFFLIYSVPAGSETKLELWVVQRKDCYIRFFIPPR